MNNNLISREALLSGFNVRKVTEFDECGCGMDYNAVPVQVIEKSPAVDAEPVRHGRWKNAAGGRTICNLCGNYPLYDYFGRQALSPVCWNCGAHMDTKEE